MRYKIEIICESVCFKKKLNLPKDMALQGDSGIPITHIINRHGAHVKFDESRITTAILKALTQHNQNKNAEINGEILWKEASNLSSEVIETMHKENIKELEKIQDTVEQILMRHEKYQAVAKIYIIYRHERAQLRKKRDKEISQDLSLLYEESKKNFQSTYNEIIYLRTYSRWLEDKGRRETWKETVNRFISHMVFSLPEGSLTPEELSELSSSILRMEVMPSMRALQFSGEPMKLNNLFAYNCCFVAPICIKDIVDVMYLSMCGVGVGFSVEKINVSSLPVIVRQCSAPLPRFWKVGDSKEGWCDALFEGLSTWFAGHDIKFDYSGVRPSGARLVTSGGRASGPEPLKQLLDFSK